MTRDPRRRSSGADSSPTHRRGDARRTRAPHARKAPLTCSECAAVHLDGRWTWSEEERDDSGPTTCCPACQRIQQSFPAGEVIIECDGLSPQQRAAALREVRHLAVQQIARYPLRRVMAVAEARDEVAITVTDTQLAHGLGDMLLRVFGGELSLDYQADGAYLRVSWRAP